ncbi:MAG: arginine--tRNA ligase [Firmicutes bacterium]|nr:arginine--tRNA ligase [Bacillota bacterium]
MRPLAAAARRFVSDAQESSRMTESVTERLTAGVRAAVDKAGLPEPERCVWEVPRQAEHGDWATNVAMQLARAARRPPRAVAELIASHFPALPEVERVDVAGPGFLNVTLSPAWCAGALRTILAEGEAYGRGRALAGTRARLEFVSANPTGPLVIVNARAAAVGDALARLLRAQGAHVVTEYYVNDAGNQFEALARSFEARVRQRLGQDASLPEPGYPGEYLIDLARDYVAASGEAGARRALEAPEPTRLQHFGRWAVDRIVAEQRRVLADYGVEFDVWRSEQRDVRDRGLPERAVAELTRRGLTHEHEGALWFRSPEFGDDKERVLRRSSGEFTYFAVDLAYHHYLKFEGVDRVINLFGPDHHGYVPRLRAALTALGHPPEALEVLIVQLVTLLREGEPVRMSKRRGEFVLMEDLLEEVGRDAARFTFLTRRHDSPLEFDLAVATRQSADNPVYYVQYAHARIAGILREAAAQARQPAAPANPHAVALAPLEHEREAALIHTLAEFPEVVRVAGLRREPHRLCAYAREVAEAFHLFYTHCRVLGDDARLSAARLALVEATRTVLRRVLGLLGVTAPERM